MPIPPSTPDGPDLLPSCAILPAEVLAPPPGGEKELALPDSSPPLPGVRSVSVASLEEARERILSGDVQFVLLDLRGTDPRQGAILARLESVAGDLPLVAAIPDGAAGRALREGLRAAGVVDILLAEELADPATAAPLLRRTAFWAHALRMARREAATFRTLAENLTETLAICDERADILYASPSFEGMTGIPAIEAVGRSALEFILPDDRERVLESLRMVVEGTHPPGPIRFRIPGGAGGGDHGPRILEASGENLLDEPSVRGVVVSFRDITDRVAMEARLQGSQRVEALGRLAGGIAHDFNNILTALAGSTGILLEDLGEEGPVGEELIEIHRGITRAAALTGRLLAYGRQQLLRQEVRPLGDVVRGIEPLLARVLESHIALEVEVRDEGHVRVDVGQLEQLILNLVINARDAMPGGGILRLEVDRVQWTGEEVFEEPFRVVPGTYLRLQVSDTGCGMSPEILPRIFEPFFTTKAPGLGSGLGLAMAYGFVKQSHGYILARSEEGRGSTFRVFLPCVPSGGGVEAGSSAVEP